MIPGDSLAAWLSDRAAQDRSRVGSHQLGHRWSPSPLFGLLHRELDLMDQPTPEAVLDAARRFFDKAGELDELLAELIDAARADPFFLPTFSPVSSEIHFGLLLFHHDHLSIGLGVNGVDMLAAKKANRRGPASVGFTGMWNLFRYLKAGNASISYWEAPPIEENFIAEQAGQCRLTRRERLADGDEILIDGRRESFIVDHAGGDMLYLQAMVRTGAAPLAAEYDSETCCLLGVSATDEAGSRVQMMATLLRTMEREDAVPVLREALAASPHFYTRWHLMRELLALDAEAAYPDLVRMAKEDPHPEICATAHQTLTMFFDDAPPAPAAGAAGETMCPA